ncbi:flagellar export chaperone FliS [Caproicibacterium amylolyticum]|uniref:Flagellar export chaperone FliS n=1 Tax=Caproicibacterium amylolyticum TaxID=2766537 RepID=A0A7G9WEB2_9FIRM|nr:flagellar export chaperone FliS [Caproicibacterium amylolyticum]MBE6722213.1 flagellar export chaperone FliS [Oscillospiraceae bacterium]QNO17024.1 flagellar export chaperone FliS [Caproicibacterium amylolyticum]
MAINPYEAYQKKSVMTMTPGEMLSKLYDKVIKELSAAKIDLDKKDLHLYAKIDDSLQKAQTVLKYLKTTLDFKYDIAKNLDMLYDYFISQIMQAYVHKDSAPLEEIIPMISELQRTYEKADKLSRGSSVSGQA